MRKGNSNIYKIVTVFFILVVAILVWKNPMVVKAADASLSGPGTVRAGDNITLTFSVDDSGKVGVETTIDYDGNLVTQGAVASKRNGWLVEQNGSKIIAYDNEQNNPIDGASSIYTIKFKVSDALETGTTLTISAKEIATTVNNQNYYLSTATYSVTIAEPLSKDCNLSALSVNGVTLSPAFNANTKTYSAGNVPFATNELTINATASDSGAKIAISGDKLSVGDNTVTIKVTAESGATKTYTISVNRDQDPNYVASNDTSLSGISVEGFLLSPLFTKDKDEYVVWVPYETTKVAVSGVSTDSKASVTVDGGDELLAGQANKVTVTCKAEDGTTKSYIVIVQRAPSHDGKVEETTPAEEDEYQTPKVIYEQGEQKNGSVLMYCLFLALGLAVGMLAYMGYNNFLKEKIIMFLRNRGRR